MPAETCKRHTANDDAHGAVALAVMFGARLLKKWVEVSPSRAFKESLRLPNDALDKLQDHRTLCLHSRGVKRDSQCQRECIFTPGGEQRHYKSSSSAGAESVI